MTRRDGYDRSGHGGGVTRAYSSDEPSAGQMASLLSRVNLAAPPADMFDGVASGIAQILDASPKSNKPSQVRRFYDEIIRHDTAPAATFQERLPFIRMICAHGAYAKTRGHVDDRFVEFLQDGLRKVNTPQELAMFRTLFEAVIGFMAKRS